METKTKSWCAANETTEGWIVRVGEAGKVKRYMLPAVMHFEDFFGQQPQPAYFYRVVDYRAPREGEHYVSGAIPTAYLAKGNGADKFIIAKKTHKAIRAMCWVRAPK